MQANMDVSKIWFLERLFGHECLGGAWQPGAELLASPAAVPKPPLVDPGDDSQAVARLRDLSGSASGNGIDPDSDFIEKVKLTDAFLNALARRSVHALDLLLERSRFQPELHRRAPLSCGGVTRLLRANDGLVALALARESDVEMLPALLECEMPAALFEREVSDRMWTYIESKLQLHSMNYWTHRAELLGLPMSALGETDLPTPVSPAVRCTRFPVGRFVDERPVVVDLSSLWAGPLCSRILTASGARVLKIEDINRPDGARVGSPSFFDLLHTGQEFVQIDFSSPAGREELRAHIESADIVIEGSRPRGLRNLGIFAESYLNSGRVKTWLSITGYGRDEINENRVAFGDDAAVSGGLVAHDGESTCFLGDAIADPLTGLVSACAILLSLQADDSCLLDVAMARVSASFSKRSAT